MILGKSRSIFESLLIPFNPTQSFCSENHKIAFPVNFHCQLGGFSEYLFHWYVRKVKVISLDKQYLFYQSKIWLLPELNVDAKKTILLEKRSTICIDTDDNLVPGCVCRELKWDPGELLGGSWRMHQTVSYYPCPYNPKTLHLEDALLHLCTLVGQFVGASSVQLCRPRKLALGSAGGGGGRMHLRGSRGPKPRCYPPSAAQGQVFPICRVGK